MFDMPFGMAPPVPAPEPPEPAPPETVPPPPVLPEPAVRTLMAARPLPAFGPGAPPLHALAR